MADDSSSPTTRVSLLVRLRDPADGEAWQTFVDVYAPLVYSYCRRKGLQEADASDVTQEVLTQVAALHSGIHLRPQPRPLPRLAGHRGTAPAAALLQRP